MRRRYKKDGGEIKIRRFWSRNPATKIHEVNKRKIEQRQLREEINEGLEEFGDGGITYRI